MEKADVVVMESVRCNSESPSNFEKALALRSFIARLPTHRLAELISNGSLTVTVIGAGPSLLTIRAAARVE
jgi:hypothetical protein